MSSDAQSDNTQQPSPRLLHHGFTDPIHYSSYCKIEMNIGHWYVDEFGNRTREITTRNADEEVQLREPLDLDRRQTEQVRTAAARLAQLAAI